jgi:hypothetical protein
MIIKQSRILFAILVATAGTLAPACASSPKKKPGMTLDEYERNKPSESSTTPSGDTCTDQGKPKECTTNTDCCQGYVCGMDPDLSQVRHYCLKE